MLFRSVAAAVPAPPARRGKILAFAALAALTLTASAARADEPLVVFIHGIGGGNRASGWSNSVRDAYGVAPGNAHEITFRRKMHNPKVSLGDFARKVKPWARHIQARLARIARQNPGRKIIVVAHSWGTVATKLALGGGHTKTGPVDPIGGNVKIHNLVTIGSPLGLARDTPQGGALGKFAKLRLEPGKPRPARRWYNLYNPKDDVSGASHNLHGAINMRVTGGTRLTAHTGIWTNPATVKLVKGLVREAKGPPTKPKPKGPVDKGRIRDRLARLDGAKLLARLRGMGVQESILKCLCKHAKGGTMRAFYSLKPVGGSPSCRKVANGPCVFRGYGCWRVKLPNDPKAHEACKTYQAVATLLGGARRGAETNRLNKGAAISVSGNWRSKGRMLHFRQKGRRIYGSFHSGRSRLWGKLDGFVLKGRYRLANGKTGTITYTFSANGKRLSGTWTGKDGSTGTIESHRID